ncbi:MAG: hypothetical protein M4579_006700 [Chaenotheca gracillima]|nr:MAG: hypothetical protein M4579_006700 [Chaenotheca gracillima]
MADLHTALQTLSPVDYSSLPLDDLSTYLQDVFSKCQLLIDSVPEPSDAATSTPTTGRSRANTTSSIASNVSETSLSSARSSPALPEHAALQKEWGKPIKLSAKDNPLGISVYKLSGKDGRGAWFARRSVHEGLNFSKFKKSLEREFPESLEVQGGPGEGNVRGIGGERKVERKVVDGVGSAEVYHLSAQFPGPTTPRDFVTLLLTSSAALPGSNEESSSSTSLQSSGEDPRHYVVISRPCNHADCPPRDGFIRGNYESIEFIREVPRKPPGSPASGGSSPSPGRSRAVSDVGREAAIRNAKKSHSFPVQEDEHSRSPSRKPDTPPSSPAPGEDEQSQSEGRKRGKTISFMESPSPRAKDDHLKVPSEKATVAAENEDGPNPVEWIMITRSDPGGSVPRWMVERGTPAGIVSDAGKFLDWACKKEHPESVGEGPAHREVSDDEGKEYDSLQTNGHLVGVDAPPAINEEKEDATPTEEHGVMSNITGALSAGVSAYTPAAVLDRLPGHGENLAAGRETTSSNRPSTAGSSSTSSLGSFATADGGSSSEEDNARDRSSSGVTTDSRSKDLKNTMSHTTSHSNTSSNKTESQKKKENETPQEKELTRLRVAKEKADERLEKARAADAKRTSEQTAKEAAALAKAQERHARETAKSEERFKKEMRKIEERREKEVRKTEEKQRKAAERDERARWAKEKEELVKKADDLGKEVEQMKKEREQLKGLLGQLQAENTKLAMKLGRDREEGGVVTEETADGEKVKKESEES